ncbi:hypothetical protein S100390_v1c03560 [Spiroplasma sp. NBRC 100390]|uniref:hypothetical protein n=1 Tax=unclassified Spiroplasma TaxID=2637901 RepID=UPI000892974D|nr:MULTISPECIES: hypothetical protein [unclassified Spiroplasma]AOX43699.1 hypothetical protein STU14_v1c03560 [Spiroplasma sp. TU-14]APE13169.1 hypothetical protein S100390_v1c03560 [Spiroplasma sp. NBRC 100390]
MIKLLLFFTLFSNGYNLHQVVLNSHHVLKHEIENKKIIKLYSKLIKEFEDNNITYDKVTTANLTNVMKIFYNFINTNFLLKSEINLLDNTITEIIIQNQIIELQNKNQFNNKTKNQSSIKISKYCVLRAKDSRGNNRHFYYEDNNEPLYLKNYFTSGKIYQDQNYYSMEKSQIISDWWTWRYVLYFNTCELMYWIASFKKISFNDLIYNQRYQINPWILLKGIFTVINIARLIYQNINKDNDEYWNYIKGYLHYMIDMNNFKKASTNLTNGIAIQYWWRRFNKDFISLNHQSYMKNHEEIQFNYVPEDVSSKRYEYIDITPSSDKSGRRIIKIIDKWRTIIQNFNEPEKILTEEIDRILNL